MQRKTKTENIEWIKIDFEQEVPVQILNAFHHRKILSSCC
jgi:hypothetical protein